MPLPVVSQLYDRIDIHSAAFRYFVGFLVVLFALRVWASTPSLRVRRVLHGRTVLISGGLTPLNLSLIRSLAVQGAQVILLHKFPADPILQQLLDLIRSTTENERVYAEPCDTSASSPESIESIHAFSKKWNATHKRSPLGEDLGPEPIDTLILSDDEFLEKKTGFGTPSQASLDYYNASLRSKILLVQGLLPALRNSKTRIVNIVAPFYAASPPLNPPSSTAHAESASFIADLPWRSFQPWTFSSPSSLCSIVAFRHLAHAELGPGADLPEPSVVQAAARERKMTVVSVSTGLTRSWLVNVFTSRSPTLGWPLCLLLSPLIFAMGKSMPDATKEIERSIHGDFLDLHKHPNGIPSGSLIVGGRVVLLSRREFADPAFGEAVWEYETKQPVQVSERDSPRDSRKTQ